MSDRLVNFIRNNRKQLDELEPPVGLWDKIEQQLEEEAKVKTGKQERVIKLSFLLRAAATTVIVLTAGIVFWKYQKKESVDISSINPQLAQEQVHYASMIQEKRTELKRIEKQDPQLYEEFSSEIKTMDENYQKLKKDLPSSPNQEKTVKAMIRNLQIQIQVLNQQLEIIGQVNQLKKEQQNETQSI
jgi:hypothetical protein